jgi:hypothetical protein
VRDGTRLLLDFFAPPGYAPSGDAGAASAALAPILAQGDTEVQFLLATVPEPRLGLDGAVESATRAIESAGYTLDRHSLPWDGQSKGPSPCYERHPGTALFVHASDPKAAREPRRLLLLYLVGETPTSGIYKLAFLRAVDELRHLQGMLPAERCAACSELRLVGPAFSGSVTSLEILLDELPDLSFNILSGRATNAQLQPLLTRHSNRVRHVRFQATVIPDEALQSEFYCYLTQTMGADEHDVALVTESSTAYGQAVIAANAAQVAPLTHYARVSPLHPPPPPVVARSCSEPHGPRLTLPVPIHISRLHSALAKRAAAPHRDAAGDGLLPLPTAMLPALLDDSLRTDIIPTLSERTLASQERALAQILATISAEKIRYVGILATDVEDKLFLAYQIRAYSPDVVLFTFESDILYTHPEARSYLKGMLVVSPYPLFTRNQQWSFPFRGWQQRLQFASEADQGMYNATVALLGHPEQLIEYSQAAPGIDTPQSRPAIWISAVGNESLFPLACIKDYSDGGYVYQNPMRADRGEYLYSPYQQGALRAVLLILGLCGLLLCAGYFRCYYAAPGELGAPWSWLKVLRPSNAVLLPKELPAFGQNEVRRQPMFMLFIFLPMAVGYLLVGAMHFVQLREGNLDAALAESTMPLWLRFWHHSRHLGVYQNLSWQVLAVGILASVCQFTFTVTVLDVLACWLVPSRRVRLQEQLRRLFAHRQRLRRVLAWVGVVLIALVGSGLFFMLFVHLVNRLQHSFNTLLFLNRSSHPAFGLSPALPLWILVADIQLWGYYNLQRIALLDKLASIYLELIEELTEETGLQQEVTRIARQLESPGHVGVLMALVFSLVLSVTLLADLVSLEHWSLNLLFRFLYALLLSCTGYAFYRLMGLWYGVRRFLQLLAHHPLAPALERLPAEFTRSLSVLLLEDLPDLTRRQAERQLFGLLLNHLNQLSPRDLATLSTLGPEVDGLVQKIKQVRAPVPAAVATAEDRAAGQVASESSDDSETDSETDRQMVYAARLVVQLLKRFWPARPLPGTVAGRGDEKPAVSAQGMAPGRNSAEMYLQAFPDSLHLWLRLAEDFIAIQVASYVTRIFPHLRNAMVFVTVSVLLVLTALVTYPFQPQHYLLLLVWLLIMVTAPLTILTLVQMNRDDVLSRIAKSEPGKVTWDRHFISQVIIYGVLPLLSLVASQFPEVRGMAFSWLESLLKTLK